MYTLVPETYQACAGCTCAGSEATYGSPWSPGVSVYPLPEEIRLLPIVEFFLASWITL